MLRIIRDHEDPFHQVVLRCDENIVTILYKGKTKAYAIVNRISSHFFAYLCAHLYGMPPKKAFHDFPLECDSIMVLTKKLLKERAIESGFIETRKTRAKAVPVGTSLDGP
jgi:hypothetical protein